jgi:hypothetical protein
MVVVSDFLFVRLWPSQNVTPEAIEAELRSRCASLPNNIRSALRITARRGEDWLELEPFVGGASLHTMLGMKKRAPHARTILQCLVQACRACSDRVALRFENWRGSERPRNGPTVESSLSDILALRSLPENHLVLLTPDHPPT